MRHRRTTKTLTTQAHNTTQTGDLAVDGTDSTAKYLSAAYG